MEINKFDYDCRGVCVKLGLCPYLISLDVNLVFSERGTVHTICWPTIVKSHLKGLLRFLHKSPDLKGCENIGYRPVY